MANTPSDGLDPVDSRILRLSVAADVDLTPLIHFWGVHPVNPAALKRAITAKGISSSNVIRDQLLRYAGIVPMTNTDFNAHFDEVYPGRPSGGNPDYGKGWYNARKNTWNETHSAQIVTAIQALLDTYYPDTILIER